MQIRQSKTIKINHSFICENCQKEVPAAVGTCRNHCNYCLFSKHLDLEIPGDRLSDCFGLMEPYEVDQNSKKGFQIRHQCLKCDKKIINKVAEDDDFEVLTKIIQRQNLQ